MGRSESCFNACITKGVGLTILDREKGGGEAARVGSGLSLA